MKHRVARARQSLAFMIAVAVICVSSPAFVVAVSNADSNKTVVSQANAERRSIARPPIAKNDAARSKIIESFGCVPMSFEANTGQADSRVKFVSRGNGYSLFLSSTEATFALKKAKGSDLGLMNDARTGSMRETIYSQSQVCDAESFALRMKIIGANAKAEIKGIAELPGKSNYFIGSDPSRWRVNVSRYSKVRCEQVYPGIDLLYYGNDGRLEYDFLLAPLTDYKLIRLAYEGAKKLRLDANGDLVIETEAGEVRQHRPIAYQQDEGRRGEVAVKYLLKGGREVKFDVGSYDKSKPLIIDPILTYSTYLGGALGTDDAAAIAVDSEGNAYVTGNGASDFPTTRGVFNRNEGFFVAKLNSAGTNLVYSTFIGHANVRSIAVDSSGNVYLTGTAFSQNYPTTTGAFQTRPAGEADAFVTKLNGRGTALVYSTLIGGTRSDTGNAIAVDREGSAYVTGDTLSQDYPTENPASVNSDDSDAGRDKDFEPQLTPAPPRFAFVTRLNPSGARLIYSTYLSANTASFGTQQIGQAIAVDALGNAYVAGTSNASLPTTSSAFQRAFKGGSSDAFIVKIAPRGSQLLYSTFLGGSGFDEARAIAIDAAGNAYVAGRTQLADFPTTPGAFQAHNSDGSFFKSTDGGATWSAVTSGLSATSINYLSSTPSGSALYAAMINSIGPNNLFTSADGGANWTATGAPPGELKNLVIDPANPSNFYAAVIPSFIAIEGGVFKSSDGGATWLASFKGSNQQLFVNDLAVDTSNSSTLYAGTNSGVYKTTDGGDNWISTGLPIGAVLSLAIDRQSPSTVYAGHARGVVKTTDGGASWKAAGSFNNSVSQIITSPAFQNTVYAVTFNVVYRSTDGGESWKPTGLNGSSNLFGLLINKLAIDPNNAITLYAATSKGILRSVDGGDTWQAAGLASQSIYAYDVMVDPANSATLYAGTSANTDAFVAKLNPAGSQLVYSTYLGGLGGDSATAIAIDTTGNASIAGQSGSQSFPLTVDGSTFTLSATNFFDAFITKLNANGSALIYSTFMGGSNFDGATGIAVDSSDRIYMAGSTSSTNFPTTPGAFQSTAPDSGNAFVVKISFLKLTSATVSGKKLIVTGMGFDKGAKILIDGVEQKTRNDDTSLSTMLTAKKAGKKIAPGQTVVIQVRNSDGTLSNEVTFTRSIQ